MQFLHGCYFSLNYHVCDLMNTFLGEFGVVYKGHIVKDLGQTVTDVVAIKTLKGLYITVYVTILKKR